MTTLPTFNPAAFVSGEPIDNPYFPLMPGTIYRYEGEPTHQPTEGENEINRFAVTNETKNVAGVTAQVVRDTAWADGFLQEDTQDWFAQDTSGNVWYLGEATTAFEYDAEGNFIGTNHDGAWTAGVNGALPGYIMEANPQVNHNYYQEFAPNNGAVDQAKVTSRDQVLATEFGTFKHGLQTLEFTALHPEVFEYKYYAPGVGLVRVEEELNQNLKPGFVFELESITSVKPEFFTRGRGTQEEDVIDGNDQANILNGLQGNDLLQSLGGNDRLTGQDGNDFLMGGDNSDRLYGGHGEDILIGGNGVDYLVGGNDRDQFVFRTLADRGDRIKDFTRQDVIILTEIFDLPNYGSANPIKDYLQIEQTGAQTVVRIDTDGDTGTNPFQILTVLQDTNITILNHNSFVI